jgi:hypothetical protein
VQRYRQPDVRRNHNANCVGQFDARGEMEKDIFFNNEMTTSICHAQVEITRGKYGYRL